MAAQGSAQQAQLQQQLSGVHRYRISPPRFNGEYSTFEEWKYKMTAYLGLQESSYNRLRSSVNNYADRTCSATVSRHGDNYTYVTHCHLVQEASVPSPNNTTTGRNQDCNPAQRDKRSTTTAFATTSRQCHNLRTNQITGCGVSQSSITIRQTTSGYE